MVISKTEKIIGGGEAPEPKKQVVLKPSQSVIVTYKLEGKTYRGGVHAKDLAKIIAKGGQITQVKSLGKEGVVYKAPVPTVKKWSGGPDLPEPPVEPTVPTAPEEPSVLDVVASKGPIGRQIAKIIGPTVHKRTATISYLSSVDPDQPVPGYELTGVTAGQVIKKIKSAKHPTAPYRARDLSIEQATRELMMSKAKTIPVNQFRREYPGIEVPTTEHYLYDVVKVGVPLEDESGNLVPGYLFMYSKELEHKIKHMTRIAGSPENYNKYLRIVRNNPQLVALHAFAGPLNLDLAFASNVPGITGASEREEILIRQLHRWKGSPEGGPSLERGLFAVIENPFVQIAGAEAFGVGVGKVAGGISGRLAARYGPRAVQAFNLAQIAAGGVLATPTAIRTAKKVYEGEIGEAVSEATMFGLTFGAGITGYRIGKGTPKLFGKYKGLTPYEAGFKKGLVKSKRFDPIQKEYFNIVSDIKQDLRIRRVIPFQEEPTYRNVEALKRYNQQRADILRTVIKNQLIALKHRAQISGGAGTEKVSTHDIDELFRSAKDPVVLEYIARKLGIDPNLVFDPHQLPSTGQIVTRGGAPKQPPYVYPSGQRGIQLTEQFGRLTDSSFELAHARRVKDISEAVRILDLIYGKTGGIPKHMQPKVTRFLELSAILEADPRIMDPALNKLLYDSGIGKKLWNVRTKFYRKVLPETYLSKQFKALSKKDLTVLQNFIESRGISAIPPSISMAFGDPSSGMAAWSAFFSSLSRSGYPSDYPSGYPSVYPSGYPSVTPGKPVYPKKSPDESGYPSVYDSGYPSEYPSYPGTPSFPSLPSPGYPSPATPSYPYYPYSPSYPSDVPPPPPPPPPFWWGMGGRIAGRGQAEPYGVRYYNEYEMIQKMMREVIF